MKLRKKEATTSSNGCQGPFFFRSINEKKVVVVLEWTLGKSIAKISKTPRTHGVSDDVRSPRGQPLEGRAHLDQCEGYVKSLNESVGGLWTPATKNGCVGRLLCSKLLSKLTGRVIVKTNEQQIPSSCQQENHQDYWQLERDGSGKTSPEYQQNC